jgi:hypothetical protein
MAIVSQNSTNTQEAFGENPAFVNDIARKALTRDFSGEIRFTQGDHIYGTGTCNHVGHGSIRLTISRFIMTQEQIDLELDCLNFRGHPVSLSGHVLDCYPELNGKDFIAMVHVDAA